MNTGKNDISDSLNIVGSSSITVDLCISYCESRGLSYAALQNGFGFVFNYVVFLELFKINKYLNSQNCYCGNAYGKEGAASRWSLKCNKPCSGNPSQICGGEYANSIYQVECLKQTLGLFRGEHFLFYSKAFYYICNFIR